MKDDGQIGVWLYGCHAIKVFSHDVRMAWNLIMKSALVHDVTVSELI